MDATASSIVRSSSSPLMKVLSQPWLDRTIAIIACAPFVYFTYYRYRHMGLGIPLVSFATNQLICIVTMIARRPPKRVTPNPVYWLLAFVATYWGVMTVGLLQKGHPLVSNLISDGLAIVSLLVVAWARLSLGRNIGFIPAQREIVTGGAYRYMRHPIYTGLFLSFIAVPLRAYTPRNAVILGLGIIWFLVKSIVEENFLRADPQYAAYLGRVKARWIPFVI